jgi:hypothetical protein
MLDSGMVKSHILNKQVQSTSTSTALEETSVDRAHRRNLPLNTTAVRTRSPSLESSPAPEDSSELAHTKQRRNKTTKKSRQGLNSSPIFGPSRATSASRAPSPASSTPSNWPSVSNTLIPIGLEVTCAPQVQAPSQSLFKRLLKHRFCTLLYLTYGLLLFFSLVLGICWSWLKSDVGGAFTMASYVALLGSAVLLPIQNRHNAACQCGEQPISFVVEI